MSLDLVNKCALNASCLPSARITHNPGTWVITIRQGFSNVNSHTVSTAVLFVVTAAGVGGVGGEVALFFPGQGRKASQSSQQRMARFRG